MSCTLQPDPSCSALSPACECNPCQTAARVPLTLALRAGVQSNHTLCTGYWAFVELDTATIPSEQLYTEADAPTLSPHGRIFAGHPLTDANATSTLPHALTLTLDTEYSAAARRYTSVDVFFSTASRPFAWDQTFRQNYPLSVFPASSPIYSNLDRRKQQKTEQRKHPKRERKNTKHHKKHRKRQNYPLSVFPASSPIYSNLDRRKQQKTEQRKHPKRERKNTKHHKKQRNKENGSLPLSPPPRTVSSPHKKKIININKR